MSGGSAASVAGSARGGIAAFLLLAASARGFEPAAGWFDRLAEADRASWTVPVLVISYLPLDPTDPTRLDPRETGVESSLEEVRTRIERITRETANALEQGSRFRAYRDPRTAASLDYRIVRTVEVLEALPPSKFCGEKGCQPDYHAVMARAEAAWKPLPAMLAEDALSEVWLFGYHTDAIYPVESDMAGPHGDVSNSHRIPDDLPVGGRTYTLFNYNYGRDTQEAVHDHLHQIEAVLGAHGSSLWSGFVRYPDGRWRAGGCHTPPNAAGDYDYGNRERVATTDFFDWRPDGVGAEESLGCQPWGCDELAWYVMWMQSIPGAGSGLAHRGRPLADWWRFLGDYDGIMGLAPADRLYQPRAPGAPAPEPRRTPGGLPWPVAAWDFDGCEPADRSGNGLAAAKRGPVACRGDALGFDGGEAALEVPDDFAFHLRDQLSLAVRASTARLGGLGTLVSKWYAPDAWMLLLAGDRWTFTVALAGDGAGVAPRTVEVSAPAVKDRPTEIVGTFDGTALRLYLDGDLAATETLPGPARVSESGRPVAIGNHPSWNAFEGTIDAVRIFDRALAADQVANALEPLPASP